MRTRIAFGLLVAALASLGHADTFTFGASADASIDVGTPSNNWGLLPWFLIAWSESNDSQGLLQFDISSVPTGMVITNATLDVYQSANVSFGSPLDFYANTQAWSEFAVTYNTRPTYDVATLTSLAINDGQTQIHRLVDLTSIAQGWYADSNTNHGLTVQEPGISDGGYIYLDSRETEDETHRPVLTITAQPVPEPATLIVLGAGAVGFLRRRKTV